MSRWIAPRRGGYQPVVRRKAGQSGPEGCLELLREWLERWEGADPDEFDIHDLLDSLRPLIYSAEEL